MLRIFSALCLAALCLALFTITPTPLRAEPADIAAAARSVVRVVLVAEQDGEVGLAGHGSGFAVAPNLIVTNAHVVRAAAESDSVRVGIIPSQGSDGWFAQIVAISPQNDLALLQLIGPGSLPTATLYSGTVADGADVFAIGYPGNVDLAQGLNVADMVSPTPPVKTRGNVSAGRSSKQFDTILHTAPIGAGNSGGPLLDACGRVVGVNSFGTLSDGSDSEFFFAVSFREISRFLLETKVRAATTGAPCRSIADLDRAEADRLAGERQQSDQAARTAAAKEEGARRQAQLEVIAERENGMALAGLALLLALTAGGTAIVLHQKGRSRDGWIAAGASLILIVGGAAAWMMRPSLAQIDSRAAALSNGETGDAPKAAAGGKRFTGDMTCVIDSDRSRITISEAGDVPLNWRSDGCVNGESQYGRTADGWLRIFVPAREDTATVATFDPDTGTYRADRYLLSIDDMTKLRGERDKLKAPSCGAGDAATRTYGADQSALTAMLPARPNERLVYTCRPNKGG